ncbi:MAG: Fe(3+) ABC transporter substrate-binding protein [Oscillatoriales cyanobacterium SM2_2_1]|nr:Fe(3+) ABC transporter substrate-binding protein [Oscillatoriales cyanobacterium SM2_2_1]
MYLIPKRVRRKLWAAAFACLSLLVILWWQQPVLAQDRVVNMYSARHYDTDNAIYENFTRRTGIKVNIVSADAAQLIQRIRSEGANSPADLLVTVDAGNLWRAQEAGLLQPVRSPILERVVPANLREPEGHWFALTKRARVIMYNKDRVLPTEIQNYEDLANPKWRGRIISRTSSHVYNQSLTGSVLAANGPAVTEQWARGVVANFRRPPNGNDTAQIRAIASGEADITFVNTYYLPRLVKSKSPAEQEAAKKIGVIFPNQKGRGTHINISGAGVVKTARNRQAAVQLLEYLVSAEAQEVLAKSNNEYPVRAGVTLDPVLASYGRFKEDRLNAAIIGRNNSEALKIMDRAGWR